MAFASKLTLQERIARTKKSIEDQKFRKARANSKIGKLEAKLERLEKQAAKQAAPAGQAASA
jgi:chromosome segregation ATPase